MIKSSPLLSAGLLAAALIATGCSTVTVMVPVTRPAEINLRGKSELILEKVASPDTSSWDSSRNADIARKSGKAVQGRLKQAIADSGRFKLINRAHLDKVMKELEMSASDLADPSGRKKLGKLMTGSIMIVGQVEQADLVQEHRVDEHQCSKTVGKGKSRKTVNYDCWEAVATAKVNVGVNFDVIDVQTGENLKPKHLSCSKTATKTSGRQNDPYGLKAPRPDGVRLVNQCYDQAVAQFMKAIAPWKENVRANFETDGDLPSLEMGVNYAKNGQWEDATKNFLRAVEMAEKTPDMDTETVAKAHWNLGLAYQYTSRFNLAVVEVKKAYEMTQNEDYLKELSSIEKLRKDQEKLKEQIGSDEDDGAGEV